MYKLEKYKSKLMQAGGIKAVTRSTLNGGSIKAQTNAYKHAYLQLGGAFTSSVSNGATDASGDVDNYIETYMRGTGLYEKHPEILGNEAIKQILVENCKNFNENVFTMDTYPNVMDLNFAQNWNFVKWARDNGVTKMHIYPKGQTNKCKIDVKGVMNCIPLRQCDSSTLSFKLRNGKPILCGKAASTDITFESDFISLKFVHMLTSSGKWVTVPHSIVAERKESINNQTFRIAATCHPNDVYLAWWLGMDTYGGSMCILNEEFAVGLDDVKETNFSKRTLNKAKELILPQNSNPINYIPVPEK